MVSFQCHGCGDVIRKPKLDQHHGRCHAGFDCIDCSVTFNSPAEFKSHTSCITEAEKYQKSLYNGPKSGGENGHGNARGGRGGFQGRGRGGARGGHQTHSRGTGANGMPLGAPQRMSPVITPVDDAPSTSAKSALPASAPEIPKKERKSKDQKSKSKESTGKVEVQQANQLKEHAPLPSTEKAAKAAEKKKGKSDGSKEKKNTRKSKGDHSTGDGFSTDVNAQAEVDKCEEAPAGDDSGSKAKKNKRKSKGESMADVNAPAERKEILAGDASKEEAGEQKAVGAKEMKKKKSKDKNSDAGTAKVDLETQEGDRESKEGQKKERQRKSAKVSGEPSVPPAEPPQKEDSGNKLTKRKKEGAEDGDTAVVSGGRKKTKNTPKDDADATPAAVEVKDTTSQGPSGGRKRSLRRGEKDDKTANDVSIPEGKEKKRRKRMETTE